MISNDIILLYALLGGILPALFWLWFWLREDKLHPEPRRRILLAFLGGMAGVVIVYFLEGPICNFLDGAAACDAGSISIGTIAGWAAAEEIVKFVFCYFIAIRTKDYTSPIDALEYLITTALGFAAVENSLFILGYLITGDIMGGIVTGNLRFIGASLVHVVSSAALGYMIGREFYSKSALAKILSVIGGLLIAVSLHSVFNYFIIYGNGTDTFVVFGFVWAAATLLLVLFENIKKLKAPK